MITCNKKIEDILAEEGFYVCKITGHSMEPMLNCESDSVVIAPVSERLKKYDIALYRSGEKYILHRVVKVLPDSYVLCGDNCDFLEGEITDANVIGVLREVYRGEDKLDIDSRRYKAYCRRRVLGFYPRKAFRAVKRFVRSIAKKIFKKKGR